MSVPKIPAGDGAHAKLRDEPELLIRIARADSSFATGAMTHARVENAQALRYGAVEPEAFRFFHGLLVALAISAFLWVVLAALGYGVYVLVTMV
jgi:hypothetical protein